MKLTTKLALASCAAMTIFYTAPVLADDDNSTNNQTVQTPAGTQLPNDNMPVGNSPDNTTIDDNSTPDTVSGDDDY